MKKLFSVLAIVLMCIVCAPVFVACSGSFATELKSIAFTKDVFEADKGMPVKLTYKTYPTTANPKEFDVGFECSFPDKTMYELHEDGTFVINDDAFDSAQVKIIYGTGENDYDWCTVVKKVYPTKIYFEKTTDVINKNASYNLQLMAKMPDQTVKAIDSSQFNIELTSSAPNVISVQNNVLVASSTGQSGSATIQARIKKLNGSYLGLSSDNLQEYVASIQLNVIQNIDKAVVAVSNSNQLITLDSGRDQTTQNTIISSTNQVKLKVLLYSADGTCLNNNGVSVSVISANPFAQVTQSANGEYTIALSLTNSGTACIQIISNAVGPDGNPKNFVLYIQKANADA